MKLAEDIGYPLNTLGRRLRAAREARGLSRAVLGHPEFSEYYIYAAEQDQVRPSRLALELLAARLRLTVDDLPAPAPVPFATLNLGALDEDLVYQLDHAKRLLTNHQGREALALLDQAAAEYHPYFSYFHLHTQYRFHRLRGLAYLQVAAPERARSALRQALELAEQSGDAQEIARTRNALGVAYYELDLPQQARAEHEQCLHALQQQTVKDLTLRMTIYYGLANDYWAVNESRQAIAMYREALILLQDLNDPLRHAAVCWGLSTAYKAESDLERAHLYGRQALEIYEQLGDQRAIGQLLVNLAGILLDWQDYAAVEELLARAVSLLGKAGNPLLLSTAYEYCAALALQNNQTDLAAEYAERSVGLSMGAGDPVGAHLTGKKQARAHAVRTQARALRMAALVAEQQDQPGRADSLFEQALTLARQADHPETIQEIELTYAGVLDERGAHARAVSHYRTVARSRQRAVSLQAAL
jgi:tetratricopeptide (TPR) repeat protein